MKCQFLFSETNDNQMPMAHIRSPDGAALKVSISVVMATQYSQGSLKDSYIPCRRMTMVRPQNSRFKLVAFNCDLDLESALLSYGFCTSSH